MKVFQYQMGLTQNQVQPQERKVCIRIIELPGTQCYYYSKQNLIAHYNFSKIFIFTILEDKVKMNTELTQQLKYYYRWPEQILFLENHMVFDENNHLTKIKFDCDQPQIFIGSLPKHIIRFNQINSKSFMVMREDSRLRVYSLINFKNNSLLTQRKIFSTQYYKHVVQAEAFGCLYYFNTKITKQIRKYKQYFPNKPIFNSNYLFVPIKNNDTNLINLRIYDIQSMKRKGNIQTTQKYKLYQSCIFIRDFNIIGVLYKTRLDLYDFNTLKCVNSQQINNYYKMDLEMIYDEYNGLSILIK